MKKTILVLFALFYLAAVVPTIVWATQHPKVEILPPPADPLSHPQRAWLGALEWCESRGTPTAINPKDRDGTPSYGILQFKPSTLALFEKKYGITGSLMCAGTQEAIVEQMILQGGIQWSQQFPMCTKLLGKPPHNLST